ncbi:MAG: hypothetical protein ABII00_11455 [Elusimicrobiota bacterium]
MPSVALLALLVLAAGCSAPPGVGVRKSTPKPFTEPQLGTYRPEPSAPHLPLARPVRVMVLRFKDRREIKYPSVDRVWSREAEGLGRHAQPREIRGVLHRGLLYGLGRMENVRPVSADDSAGGRDADVVISGEITRCAVSATFTKYRGATHLVVRLRDRTGRPLMPEPLRLKGAYAKKIYDSPADWRSAEPVEPRPPAPTVEKSIEDALSKLLASPVFREVMVEAAERKAAPGPSSMEDGASGPH